MLFLSLKLGRILLNSLPLVEIIFLLLSGREHIILKLYSKYLLQHLKSCNRLVMNGRADFLALDFFYSEAEKASSEVWHDQRWFKMMRCRISIFKSSSPAQVLKVRARNLTPGRNTYWTLFINLKYWGFSLFLFVFYSIMNAEWVSEWVNMSHRSWGKCKIRTPQPYFTSSII